MNASIMYVCVYESPSAESPLICVFSERAGPALSFPLRRVASFPKSLFPRKRATPRYQAFTLLAVTPGCSPYAPCLHVGLAGVAPIPTLPFALRTNPF